MSKCEHKNIQDCGEGEWCRDCGAYRHFNFKDWQLPARATSQTEKVDNTLREDLASIINRNTPIKGTKALSVEELIKIIQEEDDKHGGPGNSNTRQIALAIHEALKGGNNGT